MDRRRVALGRAALLGIPLAFVGLFFLYPLVRILDLGLRPDGRLGLGVIADVVRDSNLRGVIAFTIGQAAVSTVVTLALGLPAAYALSRLRFRGRAVLQAVAVVPFVLPTVVVGLAFGGGEGSLGALVAAHAFFNVAVVVRVVGAAWAEVDPALEDAAEELGARGWRRLTAVMLPLARPAVAGAATLVGLFSFTSFGAALLLAPPGSATIEVEIWRQTSQFLDLPVAAALTLIQIVFTSALLVLETRVAGARIEGGTALAAARPPRSRGERTFLRVTAIGLSLFIVVPLARVAARSLLGPEGFTLDRYLHVGEARAGGLLRIDPLGAIGVSLGTASTAAVIALAVGLPASFALARGRRDRSLPWIATGLPLGVSAVAVGLGSVIAFRDPPLDIRSSRWMVPIAQAVVALPFVVRIVAPAVTAIRRDLAEQAAALGASPWRTTVDVTLPVAAPAIGTAAVFAFAVSIGEFGATTFLARADAPTMPVAIVRLLGQPGSASLGQAYAMASLLMIATAGFALALGGTAAVLGGRVAGGRDQTLERSRRAGAGS
ncbi:MAG: iron ABC transporter permease [Actinomycetota bacterium]